MMTQIQITIALICVGLITFVQGATVPGAAGESATTGTSGVESVTTPRYCHHTWPCGWTSYDIYRKELGYIKHPYCVCPPTTKCDYFGDDNITDRVYVYQCRRPDGSYPPDD